MIKTRKKQLLIISMEYTQAEINEPINIDILLSCLPKEFFDISNTTVLYRDLFEINTPEMDQYDIVLISTKISSFSQLCHLLDLCEGKIVIVGGILAICAAPTLATIYPNVVFNTGECETNVNRLLSLAYGSLTVNAFKQSLVEADIPNVCFSYEQTNNIYDAERVVCNLKLQQYSKHNSLKDIVANDGLVRMETSRGCPWNNCSFCVMPWKFCGKMWRPFSISKIENEIEYLVKNGATQILFTDEDFIGNFRHISELCDIIEKITLSSPNKISFGGSTSVKTLLNLGNKLDYCLKRMHDAGIGFIFIGIESGCDGQLKRYNKGVTASMNEEIIKKLYQYNFKIDVGFIMFDADTTMLELEENLNFIHRTGLRCTVSRFAKRLRVTPNTKIFEEYKSRGLITSELDIDNLFYRYTFCDPTIELICSFVEKLDSQVLKESYQLQAIIRSSATQGEKDIAQRRLLTLRECGYVFLHECVRQYKKCGTLNYMWVFKLFHRCLCSGGDNCEES